MPSPLSKACTALIWYAIGQMPQIRDDVDDLVGRPANDKLLEVAWRLEDAQAGLDDLAVLDPQVERAFALDPRQVAGPVRALAVGHGRGGRGGHRAHLFPRGARRLGVALAGGGSGGAATGVGRGAIGSTGVGTPIGAGSTARGGATIGPSPTIRVPRRSVTSERKGSA
jgi:hypothetical protein